MSKDARGGSASIAVPVTALQVIPTTGFSRNNVGRSVKGHVLLSAAGLSACAAVSLSWGHQWLVAALALSGLMLNLLGIRMVWGPQMQGKVVTSPFRCLLAITLDLVSVGIVLSVLGVAGLLHSEPLCAIGIVYLVVVLCALIKANAMKKAVQQKLFRNAFLVRAVIAGLVFSTALPSGFWQPLPIDGFAIVDMLATMTALGCLLWCALRAARSREELSLLDPSPMWAQFKV